MEPSASEKRKHNALEEDTGDNESPQKIPDDPISAPAPPSSSQASPGKRPKQNNGKSPPKPALDLQIDHEEIAAQIGSIANDTSKGPLEKLHLLMQKFKANAKYVPAERKDSEGKDDYQVILHLEGDYLVAHAPTWKSPVRQTEKQAQRDCAAEAIKWCLVRKLLYT